MTTIPLSAAKPATRPARPHPAARFWNRMARRYAAKAIGDPAAYAAKLDMTRELLFAMPGARVLEVGCGTGSTAVALAAHAAQIRALDVSGEMIAIAREKAERAGLRNLAFEVAPLERADAPDASQDMVMAHSVLHLLEDRDAAIGAAWRWLRPGGAFVSSTVCLAEVAPWLRPLARLLAAAGLIPPALGFFSEADLTAAMEAQGFEIERRFRPSPKAAVFLVARKPG